MITPADLRDATFLSLSSSLAGRRAAVYDAWRRLGPATTRNLASLSGIDILNVRPRTTDLVAIGLVELCATSGGEGIYRARSQSQWEDWLAEQRTIGTQLNLI